LRFTGVACEFSKKKAETCQALDQVCQQANGREVLRRVVIVVDLNIEPLFTDNAELDETQRIQPNHGSESNIQTNLFFGDFDEQIVYNDSSRSNNQILSHLRILSPEIYACRLKLKINELHISPVKNDEKQQSQGIQRGAKQERVRYG
jgi:hypothetical protein